MNRPPKVAPGQLAAKFAGELPDADGVYRLLAAAIKYARQDARRGYPAASHWLDELGIRPDWRQAGQRQQE